MRLIALDGALAICRLSPGSPVPDWAGGGPLVAIVRTPRELSVVSAEERVPPGVRAERGWRALEVEGPLDLGVTGLLAALAAPLSDAGVSLFAVSTFDTDYVLVRGDDWGRAVAALEAAGHSILDPR